MEARGDIEIAESLRARAIAADSLLASERYLLAAWSAMLGGASWVAACLAALYFAGLYQSYDALLFAVACGIMFLVAKMYHATLRTRLMVQAWGRRASTAIATIYRIEADGLACEARGDRSLLAWEGISEISLHRDLWVVISGLSCYALPRRLFATATAEKAFIESCRSRLSAATQSRRLETAPAASAHWVGDGNSPRRWLIAVLLIAIVGPVVVLALGSNDRPGAERYAAIAVADNNANGYSWDYSTAAEATRVAMASCERQQGAVRCRATPAIRNGCLAFVTSANSVRSLARGVTNEQTKAAALRRCQQSGGQSCRVRRRVCSFDPV